VFVFPGQDSQDSQDFLESGEGFGRQPTLCQIKRFRQSILALDQFSCNSENACPAIPEAWPLLSVFEQDYRAEVHWQD